MEVTPHLKIGTPLAEITPRATRKGRGKLEALYEFTPKGQFEKRHRSCLSRLPERAIVHSPGDR